MAATRKSKKATRRSGGELRHLILAAARECFAERGYAETGTKQIALSAGVAEQSIFSHFGSKQGVYEAAVLEPFGEFVQAFTAEWADAVEPGSTPDEVMGAYVDGLYDLARANRETFRALPADHAGHPPILEVFATVEGFVRPFVEDGGYTFDPAIAVRSVFILVTQMAVLEDDILPGRDRDAIKRSITRTLMYGLTWRPD